MPNTTNSQMPLLFILVIIVSAMRCWGDDSLSLLMAASNTANGINAPGPELNITKGPAPKPVWDRTASFGLTATAGNSDSVLMTGNLSLHRKAPQNEWTLGVDGSYGQAGSVKNNESLHGVAQYNHLFTERWYDYAHADALHDAIADVIYRIMFSPGAGYYLLKQKQTYLASEAGPAILYEKLDGHYHTYPVLRVAERFKHNFDDHASLWQNLEFLPPGDNLNAFLMNIEIGIETPIASFLSLQTYLQDDYANEPAPGYQDNDVKVVSALAIKF